MYNHFRDLPTSIRTVVSLAARDTGFRIYFIKFIAEKGTFLFQPTTTDHLSTETITKACLHAVVTAINSSIYIQELNAVMAVQQVPSAGFGSSDAIEDKVYGIEVYDRTTARQAKQSKVVEIDS